MRQALLLLLVSEAGEWESCILFSHSSESRGKQGKGVSVQSLSQLLGKSMGAGRAIARAPLQSSLGQTSEAVHLRRNRCECGILMPVVLRRTRRDAGVLLQDLVSRHVVDHVQTAHLFARVVAVQSLGQSVGEEMRGKAREAETLTRSGRPWLPCCCRRIAWRSRLPDAASAGDP